MSYTKQNFQPKQPLTAAAMNQIEAGIIANEEAIAAAKNSLLGYKTSAGGKGFKITGFEDTGNGTGKYTLSSVTGLETEMRYSAVLSSANYNAGKIIEIVGNVVTVDGYKDIEFNSNADNADEFNVYNFLTIVDRPDLGDREVGFNAHAEGENTIASNKAAHAEGSNTKAIGKFAHAEGNGTIAGHGAHAEGSKSQALGDISHAEGNNTKARGKDSHAEGNNTETGSSATGSHAEGVRSKAYAVGSHAEGIVTIAASDAAHAEGSNTVAAGEHSHAGGYQSHAKSKGSFVHGEGLTADADYQAVFGQYNKSLDDAAFIVGNGSDEEHRRNSFVVKKNGSVMTSMFADSLKKAVSDKTPLVLDDISSVEHEMKVKVSGVSNPESVKVKRYGKNIINMDRFVGNALSPKDNNGVYTLSRSTGSNTAWCPIYIPANTSFTFSFDIIEVANWDDPTMKMWVQYPSGVSGTHQAISLSKTGRRSVTIKTKAEVVQIQFYVDKSNSSDAYFKFKNPQFEINMTATEYEPFVEPVEYSVNTDGTIDGATSLYPTTVFIADTTDAVISCEYNRDADKAFKELGDLIDENNDAIEALKTVATNKADKSNTVVTGSFSMGRKEGTDIGNNSFAVGTDVTASGTNSYASGQDTVASGWQSHAEGHISQATGYGAHAENGQTKAIGGYSHAEGYLSEAQGDNSHSEGMKTKAIGNNSHASGQETKAEGANSVAAGHATQAIGNNSFATGAETKASSPDTFTAGLLAKAGGKAFQVSSRIEMPSQDGFAVGGYVVNSMTGLQTAFNEAAAQGQMLYYIAHIEADDYYELGNIIDITRMPNTIIGAGIGLVTPKSDVEKMVIPSVGNYLMIMGCPELGDIEVGLAAFAEGIDTRAQHRGAHVEGISAISAGPGAHAEGILARAVHFGSHAEGFSTIAGGAYSHAGGYASETGADHAFAHGEKVYAYEKNQTVFGQYNQMNPNAAFIVGNGSDDTSRSNAIEILKNGDAIVSKDLYVNGTSKVATTNDLDSLAAELDNIKTKIAAALNKTVEELFG